MLRGARKALQHEARTWLSRCRTQGARSAPNAPKRRPSSPPSPPKTTRHTPDHPRAPWHAGPRWVPRHTSIIQSNYANNCIRFGTI